jgi:hypothetical protein
MRQAFYVKEGEPAADAGTRSWLKRRLWLQRKFALRRTRPRALAPLCGAASWGLRARSFLRPGSARHGTAAVIGGQAFGRFRCVPKGRHSRRLEWGKEEDGRRCMDLEHEAIPRLREEEWGRQCATQAHAKR